MNHVINVKLGNGFDTNGCAVEQAVLYKERESAFKDTTPMYLVITHNAVAIASIQKADDGNEFWISTHRMPCPQYRDWVLANWDVKWEDVAHLGEELQVIETGIRDDERAELLARLP